MRKMLFVASIICAVVGSTASGAQAAVPSNDDIGAATVFTDVPFTDALDTSEATYAETDTGCGGATVWYRFTPAVSGGVEIHTVGSDYDTMLALHTGEPPDLTVVACNDDSVYGLQSQIIADVTAGETYFISAGTCCSGEPGQVGPGGNLVLTVQDAPPPITSVSLIPDRRGTVDDQGVITLTGTITCDQPASGLITGSVTQQIARNVARIFGSVDVSCGPEPTVVTVRTQSTTGTLFGPGPARSEGTVTVFDRTGTPVSASYEQRVQLTPIQG